MMEDNKNTMNEQQAQQNATQAEIGGDQGRTFTQDEVNKIVSERLARERAKGEPTPQELKEKELSARENRIACREYIIDAGFSDKLLDVFPTDDVESFKASVDCLKKVFPQIFGQQTGMTVSTGGEHGTGLSTGCDFSQAFRKGRM